MIKLSKRVLLRVLGSLAVSCVLAACAPSGPRSLPLTASFDDSPTGFTLQYPEEWVTTVPVQGVMLAGPPEVIDGVQAGPLFTVLRGLPISITGDLSGALQRYLENGPLTEPDNWRITKEDTESAVGERPARTVELEGTDSPDKPVTFSRVTAVAADNTFVYLIVASVPVNLRERYEPTLNAMTDSIVLLE